MAQTLTHPSYLSPAEGDALVAANLAAGSAERSAWEALDAAGKGRVLAAASAEIDAIAWVGRVDYEDVGLAWPRVDRYGNQIMVDPDEETGDWTVPSVPTAVRVATALIAAAIASREAGTDPLAHVHDAAAAGVPSLSSRGHSESIDRAHTSAMPAWARLTVRAQRLLEPLRRRGGRVT